MSAKKEETRERRFRQLLDDSANGLRVASVTGDSAATAKKKGRQAGPR
jgi:hypothetical protein